MSYIGRKGQTAPLASADLPTNSISTAHLINDAVTSAKIGVDVIVAEDIAANAITVAEIADDAVTGAKLANDIAISTTGAITTTGAFTSVGIDDDASGATAITINASEQVGVGNAVPHRVLDVMSNAAGITFPLRVYNDTADGAGEGVGIQFGCDYYGADGVGDQGKGALIYEPSTSYARGKFHFLQNSDADRDGPVIGDAVMTIDNSGKVGIGTATPSSYFSGASDLVIGNHTGNHGLTINCATDGNTRIAFSDGTSGTANRKGSIIYTQASDLMSFYTNDTLGMSIDSSGNVGIGVTSPSSDFGFTPALHVYAAQPAFIIQNDTEKFEFCMNSGTDHLRIGAGSKNDILNLEASSGNVGIGIASPANTLNVYGAWNDLLRLTPNSGKYVTLTTGTTSFGINANDGAGGFSITHATLVCNGTFNETSDVGLKENIISIENGLDIVNQLNPVVFDWKNTAKGSNSGFIAQQVELILPDDVSGEDYAEINEDEDQDSPQRYGKAINTVGIVAHLTKAIQELSAKVTALENA